LQVKIFSANSTVKLQDAINEWLAKHPVSPDSMRFEYSAVYCDDPIEHIVEHTVILFYIPMRPI